MIAASNLQAFQEVFMKKLVIALGGNALGNTPYEQLRLVTETAKPIVDLIEAGNQVVIAHGNGPQVGMINLAMSTAANAKAIKSDMPFPECGAMSQGYIGYHLQNSIQNELKTRGIRKSVATVVTQVLVDENDPAFSHPTKPIGAFYSKEEADKIAAEKGYTMIEDAGRGYRQVVPSPKPVDVVEKDMVNTLIDAGHVVITVGGGGIPVIEKDGKLLGVPAVIDKDFASAKLAELVHADALVILTAVDRVAINWGKPNQESLERMTCAEAEQYCKEGHFAPGSMLPKVQAAMSFARTGGEAIIASLENAAAALRGESGTKVVK
jgi:carbamate kinase